MRPRAMHQIRSLARRQIKPVTIRQLLARSAKVSEADHVQHAGWLREELPVRLAHRLSDFLQLPYVIMCNSRFHEVFRLFFHAFETLAGLEPIRDADDVAAFAVVLRRLVGSTDDMVRTMQEGYGELQTLLDELVDLDTFINQVFVTRIGNRVLAKHFLEVHEARANGTAHDCTGVVQPNCRPADVVDELSRSLGDLCCELYGARPRVTLEGQTDTEFSFVPDHLNFMLQEIIKNAFRATMETHLVHAGESLPPVSVEIMKGSFDVTLKISDCGGGMRREKLEQVWKYGYTSARGANATVGSQGELSGLCGQDSVSLRQMAGYGFGLPLSRVYAQYFGGDIHVQSMHGYGTDVYLNVNHLGDAFESDAAQHTRLVAS